MSSVLAEQQCVRLCLNVQRGAFVMLGRHMLLLACGSFSACL